MTVLFLAESLVKRIQVWHWVFFFFSFLQSTLATVNIQVLPDKGQRLVKEVQDLEAALSALNISTTDTIEKGRANCFSPRTLQNVLLLRELGS